LKKQVQVRYTSAHSLCASAEIGR